MTITEIKLIEIIRPLKIAVLSFSIASLLFTSIYVQAQPLVKGSVRNNRNEPISNATVVLLSPKDSSTLNGTVTDKDGWYTLEKVKRGTYLISVSMVGHDTAWANFIIKGNEILTLPTIVLTEGSILDEVVIKGRKSLFELKQDRIIMNVSASAAFSGNNGLELLQKTPGVIVDRQNNNITMNAKGEVLIMINDQIQRLPMEVLLARLQGMRAENIKQIEIIQQPPAKYDASGAAGIIHIVLKENSDEGSNANISLIAGYGQREKIGFTTNLNSRKGKWNMYGTYNFNLDNSLNYIVEHFREYEYQGDNYYHENFVNLRSYGNKSHAGNIGVDIELSKRTVIGLLFSATRSTQVWAKEGESKSYDYINNVNTGQQGFHLNPVTDIASFSTNLNLIQKIGAKSNLTINLDYASLRYENETDLKRANDSAAVAKRKSVLDFYIGSIDYLNELRKDTKLEFGLKTLFNNSTSKTSSQNFTIAPDLFSGTDSINERILAAYLSVSKKLSKKVQGELGIRYEHYIYNLKSEKGDDFAKAFKNLFPIIRINYQIDSSNALQLAFNRSITRPPFFNLTSFLLILDSSIVVYSNPRLRPAFTNTLKITYARKAFILSLAYLTRKGQLYFLNTVNKPKHLQTSVPINLDSENMIEATLTLPVAFARCWKSNWTLNGIYHMVKDQSNHSIAFQNSITTVSVQLNNTFIFGEGWTASIDGSYRSWFLVGDQKQLISPYLNVGIRKQFARGNTLGLVFQDLTNQSQRQLWEYHQPSLGIRTYGDNNFSERQFRVTYTHLLGNAKLSDKRERKTGAEEVKSRM